MKWNEAACMGNPTHSRLLTRLLCSIKCFQVQHQGATARVRRPMTQDVYKQVQEFICGLEDKDAALGAATYFCFQFA
jgi:hypothetical protein